MLAGDRPLDTVSEPIPNTAMLQVVDTAAPLDDPEEKAAARYLELYGLSARPYWPLGIPPAAMGGIFVFPRSMAPAEPSFDAMNESDVDCRPARAGDPLVTVRPSYL